jgi:hypothetical protein
MQVRIYKKYYLKINIFILKTNFIYTKIFLEKPLQKLNTYKINKK